MVSACSTSSFFFKKASFLILIKTLLTINILVYAVSIVATPHIYQAITRVSVKVINNLTAVDKGFTTVSVSSSVTGTCPSGNVTFSPVAGTANTAIVANDYV